MTRIAYRDFSLGLFLEGAPDTIPETALRQCEGVHLLRTGVLRSADPLEAINAYTANQYARFRGHLYQGNDTRLLKDGTAIDTGYDGHRLSFLKAPAGPELPDDYLFVAGGGQLRKILPNGTPQRWGIQAPPDGLVATAGSALRKQIDACDGASGSWVRQEGAGAQHTLDTDVKAEGTGSAKWSFDKAATTSYAKLLAANLEVYATGEKSPDQDYIQFWIRLSPPGNDTATKENGAAHFEWVEIAFAVAATAPATAKDAFKGTDVYSRRVSINKESQPRVGLVAQNLGTAAVATAFGAPLESDIINGEGAFGTNADTRALLDALSQTEVFQVNDVWQLIRLPKATFDRIGSDPALTWADVQAVRLSFYRTGAIDINIDDIELTGGYGLIGSYKYLTTFLNSTTGCRSNPNETAVQVEHVNRQPIALSTLPVSTDPQVDTVEIWRTVGNGEAFFKCLEVPNGQIYALDTVIDFAGLVTGHHFTEDDLPDTLSSTEVELNNDPPANTARWVCPHMFAGRVWWVADSADGQAGRAFYSRTGRPESLDGFVNVSLTPQDEPTQAAVVWNDVLYVFTTKYCYRITGEDEPFVVQQVMGVPGTLQPHTVVSTPAGVIFEAPDGIRLFNGAQATLLSYEAVAPLWRGESVGELGTVYTPTLGRSACYSRDEYFWCDGHMVLVFSLRTQTWRVINLDAVTLYAENDNELVLAARLRLGLPAEEGLIPGTYVLESPTGNIGQSFRVQPKTIRTAADTPGILQRLLVDIDTAGVDVTPVLLLDDGILTLPVINTTSRQTVEFNRLDVAKRIGVELQATPTARMHLYGIELDVYVPGEGG